MSWGMPVCTPLWTIYQQRLPVSHDYHDTILGGPWTAIHMFQSDFGFTIYMKYVLLFMGYLSLTNILWLFRQDMFVTDGKVKYGQRSGYVGHDIQNGHFFSFHTWNDDILWRTLLINPPLYMTMTSKVREWEKHGQVLICSDRQIYRPCLRLSLGPCGTPSNCIREVSSITLRWVLLM